MCYLDIIASPFSPFYLFPAIVVFVIAAGILLLCGAVLVIIGFRQEKKRKDREKENTPAGEPHI